MKCRSDDPSIILHGGSLLFTTFSHAPKIITEDTPPPMAAGLEPLHIDCDERDSRFLNGGNFFGTEDIAEPPLSPLDEDTFMEPEASAAGATSSSTPTVPPTKLAKGASKS